MKHHTPGWLVGLQAARPDVVQRATDTLDACNAAGHPANTICWPCLFEHTLSFMLYPVEEPGTEAQPASPTPEEPFHWHGNLRCMGKATFGRCSGYQPVLEPAPERIVGHVGTHTFHDCDPLVEDAIRGGLCGRCGQPRSAHQPAPALEPSTSRRKEKP